MSQYIAHAREDGGTTYVCDVFPEPVRRVEERGHYRAFTSYEAVCYRCGWSKWGRDRDAASLLVRRHSADVHGGRPFRMKAGYVVQGHCIQCAGAIYAGKPIDRLLRPFDADEPVYRVADGFDKERLPWKSGYLCFRTEWHPVFKCPTHKEPLRFWEAWLETFDGMPATFFTEAMDGIVFPSVEYEHARKHER